MENTRYVLKMITWRIRTSSVSEVVKHVESLRDLKAKTLVLLKSQCLIKSIYVSGIFNNKFL